ncbi:MULTISPECIES: hypothetical protein [unclassified Chryseobacterium]|uniref:hypothetical protein n=1 Tax=unclassified Chryseobacterium TaxID=2593645 RepID=UPI000E0C8A7A|nr:MULTISPECIES: hypothetical protein [unclassified Chryseobacterium]MDQ1855588.1 hypothetical protein [Chryseobacterium sp. WLY505]
MKKIYVMMLGAFATFTFAQVGLNTPNPRGMFHLDGKKNNETSGPVSIANQADDVVMTADGHVGIGNNNPASSLDIKTQGTLAAPVSGIKITDGAQNENYVLTSDANGNGLWKPVRLTVVRGTNGTGIDIPFTSTGTFQYTGSYIDLPQGKWLVTVQQLIIPTGTALTSDQWMWIRTSFSDQPTINPGDTANISGDIFEAPVLVSGLIQGPTAPSLTRFSIIQGSLIVNNSSGAVKRYKYIAGNNVIGGAVSAGTFFQGFGGNYSENIIYAVPTN